MNSRKLKFVAYSMYSLVSLVTDVSFGRGCEISQNLFRESLTCDGLDIKTVRSRSPWNMWRHLSCPAYQQLPAPAEREEDGFVLVGETISERNATGLRSCPNQEDLPPSYEMTMSMSQSDRPPVYSELPPSLPYFHSLSLQDQFPSLASSYSRANSSCNNNEVNENVQTASKDWSTFNVEPSTRTPLESPSSSNQGFRLSNSLLLLTSAKDLHIPVMPALDLDKFNYDFSLERSFLRDSEADERVGTLVEIDSRFDAGWNVHGPLLSDIQTDVLEFSGFG
ncbi:uncharacterized protein LOC135494418 [Lineus longissimus]|uniref:uncharacterized protein LOC135494418 n=1 Tax=Lineus longissimus TaxID=88925 RepID=UPI002B4DCDCF